MDSSARCWRRLEVVFAIVCSISHPLPPRAQISGYHSQRRSGQFAIRNDGIPMNLEEESESWRALPRAPSAVLVIFALLFVAMTSLRACAAEVHPSQADRKPSVLSDVSPAVLSSPHQIERLDRFIDGLMKCRGVPGLAISVVVGNQVVLTREYGSADVQANRPVTKDTIFGVASLTKAFTTILLAILLNRHGYTWDVKVRDILGDEFRLYDDYLSEHVTVRDLLLHRTGIPRYDLLWFSGKMNKDELLRHLRCLKPADDFRSKAIYNNILYMLAGHVTEILGGKSWEELITEEILRPLGMNQTAFFHDRRDMDHMFAKQYALFNGQQTELDYTKFRKGATAIAPAIGLCTTASDMTNWMEFILSKGSYKHNRRLEYNDIMDEVFTSQILAPNMYYSQIQRPRTPVSLTLNTYGLAWLGGYYRGYPLLSHYGSFPGFFSMVSLLRIYSIGIFTAINGGNQYLPYTINSLIHTYILDLLLAEQPWIESGHYQDPQSEACYFPHDAYRDYTATGFVKRTEPYWRDKKSYVGTYVSPIYADLTVWIDRRSGYGGGGALRMSYGLLRFTLYPQRQEGDTVDVFLAETDHKDWLIPSLQVHFLVGDPGGGSGTSGAPPVHSLELPELKMKSGGSVFTRVPDNKTNSSLNAYSCYHKDEAKTKAPPVPDHFNKTTSSGVTLYRTIGHLRVLIISMVFRYSCRSLCV